MGQHDVEVFGSQGQQDMERRAWALWQLLGDDPAYASHGRALGVVNDDPNSLVRQIAMARLVGACACEEVGTEILESRAADLQSAGLVTDSFVNWSSGDTTISKARARLSGKGLSDDLTIVVVDSDTPPDVMAELDRVTQACEVLLPMGPFMRGIARPSVCVAALDANGRAVGTSASVAMFHPGSRLSGICWWGMLATDPDRRGEGIASYLGAYVLDQMHRRFGYDRYFTGIRTGNAPSEALCTKFGFAATDDHVLIAIDPTVLGGGRVTK
ncbi:GNAT family N-acetyltransferase [Mesobacterium sp. TK19101]|uniref:GNAT family N-acetyltransferase n=1 Tax=Mesobacterium hydrothermale TaxID=3111907 RepID=A0ABU6HEM8_9RHOB|nr:GNAT family N-acetyltransferase [Mesobacterium sp. TK19101]MEC3860923.1 GNAT family N-acetyltransferase [Mesobacterium sp. TK19101]